MYIRVPCNENGIHGAYEFAGQTLKTRIFILRVSFQLIRLCFPLDKHVFGADSDALEAASTFIKINCNTGPVYT